MAIDSIPPHFDMLSALLDRGGFSFSASENEDKPKFGNRKFSGIDYPKPGLTIRC